MASTKTLLKTGYSRLFIIVGGAGPGRTPRYIELGRAAGARWPINEPTDLEVPNPDAYDDFIVVDQVKGARQKPSYGWVNSRAMGEISIFKQLRDLECPFDLQVHYGICENPRDFDGGWQMVEILEGALTDWNSDEAGAMQSGDRARVNENGTANGQRLLSIVPITFGELNASAITKEIVDVTICDSPSCGGACGAGSDGCQRVFALEIPTGTDPGDEATVYFSKNGGSSWSASIVDALAAANSPNALSCVGQDLVVIAAATHALYWAPIADVLAGTETWAEIDDFTTAKGPRAIFSLGPTQTWFAGAGGYLYFSDNVESSVEVQDAGNVTSEDLNAIHGVDAENVVAVGDSNVIVRTTNGGASWSLIVGPAVGDDLTSIWMKTAIEWLVGTDGGQLFYTDDAGTTWVEVGFSGSGSGVVTDIAFSNNSVGYLAHQSSGTKGRILRTINGGATWRLPSGVNAIGGNDRINALAVCANPNRIFGGGLADNGTDGYLVQGG